MQTETRADIYLKWFLKLSKTTANIICSTFILTSIQCQILIKISTFFLNFNMFTREETDWLPD